MSIGNKLPAITVCLLFLMPSCIVNNLEKTINCSSTRKEGTWIEVDSIKYAYPMYSVSHYHLGVKHGSHYAYYLSKADSGACVGVLFRHEKGKYRNGKKQGLWIYYTVGGYYANWVYYLGDKAIHQRLIPSNARRVYQDCHCN